MSRLAVIDEPIAHHSSFSRAVPLLGAIGQKQLGNFTTPFADPARHPNYKPNHSLKQGNEDACALPLSPTCSASTNAPFFHL